MRPAAKRAALLCSATSTEWTCTVDGKEVEIGRVDYVLRAIRLEPGKHTVVFRFDPQSIHVTERIAYLSFGILSVLFLFSLLYPAFRARRRSDR